MSPPVGPPLTYIWFPGIVTLTAALRLDDTMTETSVDPEEVRHVADLARVAIDEEALPAYADQFGDILDHFDALDEVPEVDAEPDLVNVLRPDETRESLSQAEALRNAPETEDGKFKGPNVS